MTPLTPARRRELKALAHHLHPVVMIGNAGLTPAVIREIDINLKSHGLIKIRVSGDDRSARKPLIDDICDRLDAAAVQNIGKILVVYRPRPEDEAAAAMPGDRSPHGTTTPKTKRPGARRESRRTKRSFQGS